MPSAPPKMTGPQFLIQNIAGLSGSVHDLLVENAALAVQNATLTAKVRELEAQLAALSVGPTERHDLPAEFQEPR